MDKPRYEPPSEKEQERKRLREEAWDRIQAREKERAAPKFVPLPRSKAKSARKARRKNRR